MKLFECRNCQNLLYFENTSCEKCGLLTGYIPAQQSLSAVKPDGATWVALTDAGGRHQSQRYRFCANWEQRACNWLVDASEDESYCVACQHNRTIPDVSSPARHALWTKMETAKRRLFYALIKLGLPLPKQGGADAEPLVFEFLDDRPGKKVMTGHDNGVITISLAEANDADREKLRTGMNEPYRTLLGHFRHEVGHFYWDRLVRDDAVQLASCRNLFGDERVSYEDSLQRYYASGPPETWQETHVSAYATMHPWEDFAETWAHYLHIVDTLEMAYAFGMTVRPRVESSSGVDAVIQRNPYRATSIEELMDNWLPITFAVNSLNRTMGQPDLYPFVVSRPVARKLNYIRQLVCAAPETGRLVQP